MVSLLAAKRGMAATPKRAEEFDSLCKNPTRQTNLRAAARAGAARMGKRPQ